MFRLLFKAEFVEAPAPLAVPGYVFCALEAGDASRVGDASASLGPLPTPLCSGAAELGCCWCCAELTLDCLLLGLVNFRADSFFIFD